MAQHGPRHTCGLVGQGHRRHVRMSLPGDAGDPATEPVVFVFCPGHHRSGTMDHQHSQINITPFTNAEQAIFIA